MCDYMFVQQNNPSDKVSPYIYRLSIFIWTENGEILGQVIVFPGLGPLQGWQNPWVYEYCPAQQVLLGKSGFTRVIFKVGKRPVIMSIDQASGQYWF